MRLNLLLPIIALSMSVALAKSSAAPTVTVVNVESRPLELVSTQPASIEAFYEADLNAKITGYVSNLKVDIGDQVREGQTLFEIDAPEIKQALISAEAQLEKYKSAEQAAVAKLKAIESESARISALVSKGSLNEKTGHEATQRLETARAELAAAQGATTAARAHIEEARALVAYSTIKAPFDGVVTARAVDPGDLVYSASSSKGTSAPLMKVAQTDKLRAIAYLPESDAVWLDIGDRATLTFSSLPGKTFQGAVARTSGAVDVKTRTIRAEVDIDNSSGALIAGIYGTVEIQLETQSQALLLPAGSVRFDGEPHVYLLNGDSTISKTPVKLGFDDGQWLQIVTGLRGGDRVVETMIGRLQDGDQVVVR